MIPKELKDYYNGLRKKGQAEVNVYLVADIGDDEFSTNPPTCRVTITATDPSTGKQIFERSKEISTTSDDRSFVVPAQTTLGVIDRWFNGQKPKALSVAIKTEPVDRWSEKYVATTKNATIVAGTVEPIHVSLQLKHQPTLGRRLNLDKSSIDKPKYNPDPN